MKKILIVLALVVALTFAFAATAFAYAPPIGLYIAWDGTGVNSNGPHADYQTATTKCAVCHSVHAAPGAGQVGVPANNNGWAGTAGAKPELLLSTSVADACSYCHIQTNMGGVQIYGGSTALYTGATAAGWVGHRSECTMCHAVHGADTYKGALTSKIIKTGPVSHSTAAAPSTATIGAVGTARAGLFATNAIAYAATGVKFEQETVFCSSCHANFSRSSDQDIVKSGGTRTHSMVAAPSATFSKTSGGLAVSYDAAGAPIVGAVATINDGASVSGAPIATYGSGTCRACHMAGGVNQTGVSYNSFPHYSNTYKYYLPGTTAYGAAALTANGAAGTPSYQDTALDGNCIICHTTVGTSF